MSTNNTVIRVPPPRFGINQIVYNRESALLGYLEAMRVEGVQFDANAGYNFYYFTFGKPKLKNQTVGDANDLRHSNTIKIIETSLCTYCEALTIQIAYLQTALNESIALLACCGGPTITGISPSSGLTIGGNAVIISGTKLSNATVSVGGVITEVDTNTDTAIVLTMPAHAEGPASVKISNPGGIVSIIYTYVEGSGGSSQ